MKKIISNVGDVHLHIFVKFSKSTMANGSSPKLRNAVLSSLEVPPTRSEDYFWVPF